MNKKLSHIEVSKGALLGNIKSFKNIISTSAKTVLVVKANAYGHGLTEVVSITEGAVDAFQVDDIEELRTLRKITKKDIFVFGCVALNDLDELVDLDGVLGCYNLDTVKRLENIGKKKNKKINIHLKVDAFLGRQGIFVDDLDPILSFLRNSKFVYLEAVYSHFSNIEDSDDISHARKQFEYLMNVKNILVTNCFTHIKHHISATSGILTEGAGKWEGDYVRLGIGAYGLWPSKQLQKKYSKKIPLRPVLRWVSHIAQIKKITKGFPVGYGLTFVSKKSMNVAVIPQGYSDGYDRGFSNNGAVLIRGKLSKVLGRIAMNMFVVDITGVDGVVLEDEVVLLGEQVGKMVTADELADRLGTINYEVVARISALLPRGITK